MVRPSPNSALRAALKRLRAAPQLDSALHRMARERAAIERDLKATVLREIPAFTATNNPEILPELDAHGARHTEEILRLLAGGAIGDFRFVRDHAQRRAAQRFPLEATLHAYRCGHKIFLGWLRHALQSSVTRAAGVDDPQAAIVDFTIEYTDAVSTIATTTYVAHTRLLADVAADERSQLLDILLSGYDESDGRVSLILRNAGYLGRRQAFCVALARSLDPAEMRHAARARRLADAVDELFDATAFRRLIDVRDHLVVIIFSDGRYASGWTGPTRDFAARVARQLSMLGNAVLVGVSDDAPSTAKIPAAFRQARLALECASAANRVAQFSTLPLQDLLIQLSGDQLRGVLPPWAADFKRADAKLGGIYVESLNAYADENMNVQGAANRLSVHPNTIYARFGKITEISGLDPREYRALTALLIIAACTPGPAVDDDRQGA